MSAKADELAKVQQHLNLLRSEHVQLQSRYSALERTHRLRMAQLGGGGQEGHEQGTSFPQNIMNFVARLHRQNNYSDMKVKIGSDELPAHKFVFSARTEVWNDLIDTDVLDWSEMEPSVANPLLEWIYTGEIEFTSDKLTMEVIKKSKTLKLHDLMGKCEEALLSSVNDDNCIKFYETAVEIEAERLKKHCFELLSMNWDNYDSEDFQDISAVVLYNLLKAKSPWPLHSAVRLKREDAVFLFLIEFNQELTARVNDVDEMNELPLNIALLTRQLDLARLLLEHKANVNQADKNGKPLMLLAIERDDDESALFLLTHGANPNPSNFGSVATPLHAAAAVKSQKMLKVAEILLEKGALINAQDEKNLTPLHVTLLHDNVSVFDLLLGKNPSVNPLTFEGFPPLWFALQRFEEDNGLKYCESLVQKGADVSMICGLESNSLLHHCALNGLEEAGAFLGDNNCDLNGVNDRGETALHLAARRGLVKLVQKLLTLGSNPNFQTILAAGNGNDCDIDMWFLETPLHMAISNKVTDVTMVLIDWRSKSQNAELRTNFDLKNSRNQTPLNLALSLGCQDISKSLIKAGANINELNEETGLNLLHSAINSGDIEGAVFLIESGADLEQRTVQGESPLDLAINQGTVLVVEMLCKRGANISNAIGSPSSDPSLWRALMKDEDLASILIRHGADPDVWSEGPDGCEQTLLHRAIDENNESAACFLIRSGCDLNSPRRHGPDGRGGEEASDLSTPLHLCCQWGLEETAKELVEHGAAVSCQDVEGKTPLHILIENGHENLIAQFLSVVPSANLDLSLRDKNGSSVFAAAMNFKNNQAAKIILKLEPMAAELYDSRGRNFLHTAILKNDFESVLFLISINVNVNSRTQDANRLTPLFLAVQVGNELIVRNLILAGASVNARNIAEQTALHLSSMTNMHSICSILLSNEIDFSAVDNQGNNALHIAVQEGHLEAVRVLLNESKIDALAFNNKGRNCLHVLAIFGKENASGIFDNLMQCIPRYPIDLVDSEGNSPLLLAYTKGNGSLCRSLVKAGSVLGTRNIQGVSVFNYQVATKQLLSRLLDSLSEEPKWGEGDNCEECGSKFGITVRKHHCRHCGRLLCSKCSDKDMPILKYNISKPVRVCDTCSDVLTIGVI